MIVWKIENYRKSRKCYKPERVYDELTENFDVSEREAIAAESWSELACIGETFYGDGFTVTVCEE